LKTIIVLIQSNVLVAVSALALTISTQFQLGINIYFESYHFLIFFSTLFIYNVHKRIMLLNGIKTTPSENYNEYKPSLKVMHRCLVMALGGIIITLFKTSFNLVFVLIPLGIISLLYSIPLNKGQKTFITLRQIPYLKIFLIAFVWSAVTVFVPVINYKKPFFSLHVLSIFFERMLFVLAITLPFDIRDMDDDKKAGIKTIPLRLGVIKSNYMAVAVLVLFFALALAHYIYTRQWLILSAFTILFMLTLLALIHPKIQNLALYHKGVLDGTMSLQGILIFGCYLIRPFFNAQ
jgi:4-hydroxybenzoate polyprenyltransferase